MANVGNHLHFHIKLSNRHTWDAFIRSLTGSIAMAVTSSSKWSPLKGKKHPVTGLPVKRFWDLRPFTRVIRGFKGFLNLRDYIEVNQVEGFGIRKNEARMILKRFRQAPT